MRLGKKYTDLKLSHLSPVWGLGRASRQEGSAAFRRLHVPPAACFHLITVPCLILSLTLHVLFVNIAKRNHTMCRGI